MIESFVRSESWIRINFHIGGITEVKFGYLLLGAIIGEGRERT